VFSVTHNLVKHDKIKYIEVDTHFIREKLDNGLIYTRYESTQNQLVDIFTKGPHYINFERIIAKFGMEKAYFRRFFILVML